MKLVKLDVTKIDKARLHKGQKGTYLDLVLHENKGGTDQYGNDGFVTQGTTKEDRAAGVKMPIIGNWRRVGQKPQEQPQARRTAPPAPAEVPDDDVPF